MKENRIAHAAVVSGILLLWLGACMLTGTILPSGEEGTSPARTPLDVEGPAAGGADVHIPPIGTPYQMGGTPFQVGDVILAGDLVMSVLGWNTTSERGMSTAGPGNVYVMVDLVLINRGRQLQDIHIFSMVLQDESGETYRLAGKVYPVVFDLSLNPGEQTRGLIPIEVPESSRGLQFHYQPYVDGEEVEIVVDLGPEPVALDLPEALSIPEAHVHALGEEIPYGDVAVTVMGWRLSQGNENARPAEGTKLVVVDVLVVNKGNEAFRFRPDQYVFLRDADLNRYEHDSRFRHSPTVFRDTVIAPGEPVRLDVVFQVPEDRHAFYLMYDDEKEDDAVNEVYVNLPAEPAAAEVPGEASVFGGEIHAMGQEIRHGDLSLAVLGWSKSMGGDFSQPEEGNIYVVVDVLVVNHGQTVDVPSWNMKLFDAQLREYRASLDFQPTFPWPTASDDIGRGERLRGQIAFEVPSESSDHVFAIELSPNSEDQVAVSLGPQPATFEPPSTLLTPNPNAFRAGEPIRLGDLELLVVGSEESYGRPGVEPESGYKFLIVEVRLTNLGSKGIDSVSTLYQYQPKIRDATGYRFDIDPFLYFKDLPNAEALKKPIAAGAQAHAFLFYDVPIESSGFVLLFYPKWILGDEGGDGIAIDLGVQ